MDVSNLGKSVGMAHRYMRNFQDMVESVGQNVTSLAKITVAAGFEMVESFEKAELQLTALTGSSEEAAAMLQKMKDFAVETPFGFDEVAKGVQILGAYGTEIEATIPLMELFGDTITKTGTGSADELRRITIAFSQIRAAGKLMTQDMNQMSNVAGNVWQAVADSMGMSVQELRAEVKTGFVSSDQALKAIVEHMLQYKGGMRDFTRTFSGAWQAAKEGMQQALGEGFMPLAKALVPLIPQVVRLATTFGKFLGPVMEGLIILANVAHQVLVVFNSLSPSTQALVFAAISAAAGFALLFTAGMGAVFVVSALVSAVIGVASVLTTLGAPAVAAMVGALLVLAGFLTQVTLLATMFTMAWAGNWGNIKGIVIVAAKTITKVIDSMQAGINYALTHVTLEILKQFDTLLTAYAELVNIVDVDFAPPWVASFNDALKGALSTTDKLIDKLSEPGGLHGAITDTATSFVENTLLEFLYSTEDSFTEFIDGPLADLFKSMLPDKVFGHMMSFMQGFKKGSLDPDEVLKQLLELLGLGDSGAVGAGKVDTKVLNRLVENYLWQLFQPGVAVLGLTSDLLEGAADNLALQIDNFEAAFDPLVEYLEGIQSRLKYAKEQLPNPATPWVAGDEGGSLMGLMGGQITSALPESVGGLLQLGSTLSMATGAVIQLILGTETIQYLFETLSKIFTDISSSLNEYISPLKSFFNVLGQLITVVVEVAMSTTGFGLALGMMANQARSLAILFVPLLSAFQMLAQVMSMINTDLLEVITTVLQPVLEAAFWVFKGLGVIVLAFATAAGALWNAFVWAVTGVIDVIQSIPGMGKVFKKLEDQLEESQWNLDAMADDMATLWNMTWDDAAAIADHTESTETATDAMDAMTESLLNVPEGYKVALARLNSATGTSPGQGAGSGGGSGGRSGGGSGGGTSGPDGSPDLAIDTTESDGAGDVRATGGVGGASASSATMRVSRGAGSGNVYIETLVVQANNLDELYNELQNVAKRKGLTSTGRAPLTTAGRFVAG
jgi:tape measure domain-containing protein